MDSPHGFNEKPSSIKSGAESPHQGRSPQAGISQKISDEEAAKWASLLLGSIKQELPPSLPSTDAAPAAKHTGSERTPVRAPRVDVNSASGSHRPDTTGVNLSMPRRVQLTVNSETLGRVHMIIDRHEGGISVVMAGEDQARGRLSSDKHTISEALSAAGVRVNSLRIVSQAEVGILLAQDHMKKKSRGNSSREEASTPSNQKSRKGKKSNLNLIG